MLTRIGYWGMLALLCGALAFAQSGPAGHWEATLQVNTREIGITLDLARNDKGAWIGNFGVPAQNATGLQLSDLTVDGNSVKFKVKEVPQLPVFSLTLAEGRMKGTLSSERGELPVEFKRTGEAKVELPAASPAVSKELEGDWEGTLKTPNGDLALVVHFKNQADKTVIATMDSPSQGARDLALEDVKQTGAAVAFALKRFGGRFEGKLNKEGTQLAGEWSQSGNSLPITLQKK